MKNPLVPVALLLALLILILESATGCFTRWSNPMRAPAHYGHYLHDDNFLHVRIDDLPQRRSNSYRTCCQVLEVADTNGQTHSCKGKILLYLPTAFNYGDELLIRCTPVQPDSADNPHQFDYRRYLQRRGICYTCYLLQPQYRLIGHAKHGLKYHIHSLRRKLIDIIHFSQLKPTQQGIAEALILGWDGDLDPQTEANFQTAGIIHLLCVSGLHVGIVAFLIGWLLTPLGSSRRVQRLRAALQLAGLWLFVLLSGMAPAATRAGLMLSFILVGQLIERRPTSLNAVAASAVVMLSVKPLLLFEAGFQLSYAAVVGLIVMLQPLQALLPIPHGSKRATRIPLNIARRIRDLLLVSLIAQLCTSPFTLYYFHRFPTYFLIANLCITPFAGLLLASVLLLLFFAWWPWMFQLLGALVSHELAATEWVVTRIAALPHALLDNCYFDTLLLFLSVAFVVLLGYLIAGQRRWPALAATLSVSLLIVIHLRVVEHRCATQCHLVFYRIAGHSAVEFFAGHHSYLVCDSATACNPQRIDFQTRNNRIYRQAHTTTVLSYGDTFSDNNLALSNHLLLAAGKTLRIVDRNNSNTMLNRPLHLDYLFLSQNPYLSVAELKQRYDFDTLVISLDNSARRREAWQQQADSLGIPLLGRPPSTVQP